MAKQVHRLTELTVERAVAERQRREHPDGGGLYLVVHPSGAKTWAVRYRQNGRPRKLTIAGAYPAIGLKTARTLAKEALERVAAGVDPGAEKVAARHRTISGAHDYPAVARLFLDRYLTKKQKRPRARTLAENARLLGFHLVDDKWTPKKGGLADRWRAKPVAEITKGDVLDVLDAIVGRGITTGANHARAALHLFFGWCARRGLTSGNPVSDIDRPSAQVPRARVLIDLKKDAQDPFRDLRLVWVASLEDPLFGPLYRFLLLTGQRRDEARGATWAEIELENAIWTIPGSRTKNGLEHEVPLSPQAVELLRAIPRIGKKKAGFVFTTTGDTMLGGLSRAKNRLDRRMLAAARETDPKAEITPWVIHDLRRTCATGMQRLGVALPVIEKILNHSGGSFAGIVGVYQRHDFREEKRAALEAWGRHLDAVTGASSGNVVEIRVQR